MKALFEGVDLTDDTGIPVVELANETPFLGSQRAVLVVATSGLANSEILVQGSNNGSTWTTLADIDSAGPLVLVDIPSYRQFKATVTPASEAAGTANVYLMGDL